MNSIRITVLAFLTILVSCGIANGEKKLKFEDFLLSPATNIAKPIIPVDASQRKTNSFSDEMLLDGIDARRMASREDWTELKTDTTAILHFKRPGSGLVARSVSTRLRPDRFLKGKLKMKSNVISSLSVNGESMAVNAKSDSTISTKDVKLTLNPAQTADIVITFISSADDPGDAEVGLEFVPDEDFENVALAYGPDVKKRFLIENTALGTRVSSLELSPDGKYLKITYTTTYGQKKSRSWTELQDAATGKILNASLPYGCNWMSKGSTLWFTVKTDDTYSLYKMDASTQRQALIAENLPEGHFTMSPDGEYLVMAKEVEGKKDKGPMLQVLDPDDRIEGHRDRQYLVKYDLGSGISSPLTYGGNSTQLECISPDSKKLLYVSTTRRADEFPFSFRDVIELDLATLKTDTIIRNETSLNYLVYSPDGKQLFITAGPESFGAIGKNNGGLKYSNDYDVQGFLFDIADRKATPLTREFNPTIEGVPQWCAADGLVYFRATDGFDLNVYSLNPKTGNIKKQNLDIPYITRFSVGADSSKWLAFTGGDYHYTGKVEIMDLKNGKIRLIDDPYSREFADTEVRESSMWNMTASDGTTIECSVTLPPDFDESKKYPMIVYYYGGCTPCQRHVSVYDPQIFASRGYVSIVINPSGTYGYGQNFSARHANAWGDRTVDDIIECVKAFCKAHTYVDDKKIGCLGASYGGFMTQYLQTKTDIFAAAVSHAGISNVASYWGEGYWGYSYSTVAAPESYPWNKPDLYTQHGSLFNADKIHTPLLLLHGNADTNVPIGESIQLFNALKILGRDVEFIQVDGENHYISNYDKRKIWQDTIMAWFAKYLQDTPQWWDSMYGN